MPTTRYIQYATIRYRLDLSNAKWFFFFLLFSRSLNFILRNLLVLLQQFSKHNKVNAKGPEDVRMSVVQLWDEMVVLVSGYSGASDNDADLTFAALCAWVI